MMTKCYGGLGKHTRNRTCPSKQQQHRDEILNLNNIEFLDLHNVIAFTQLGALDKKRINIVNFSLPSRHLIWYAENKYIMQNYPMKVMFIVIICFFLFISENPAVEEVEDRSRVIGK